VSFKNNTRIKPYGVFLDHEKEWIVIAVRGTLSLEDCITDVVCEAVEVRTYLLLCVCVACGLYFICSFWSFPLYPLSFFSLLDDRFKVVSLHLSTFLFLVFSSCI
jgi:hypothetical protein